VRKWRASYLEHVNLEVLMSIRFQRVIKLLPGVRINLSKSGAGVSVGRRGLHLGIDARGRRYVAAGLPEPVFRRDII
jgi:hypothetical protein